VELVGEANFASGSLVVAVIASAESTFTGDFSWQRIMATGFRPDSRRFVEFVEFKTQVSL
jgi:hypothetical protein